MSRNNLWQICHKNKTGNKLLTDNIVQAIRTHELGSGLVIFKERKPGYCRRHGGSHACTCFIFPKASWNVSNHSFPVLTVLPVWMTGASSATSSMGSLMFDSTHLKTHHMASILLKKRILHVSSVEQKEA